MEWCSVSLEIAPNRSNSRKLVEARTKLARSSSNIWSDSPKKLGPRLEEHAWAVPKIFGDVSVLSWGDVDNNWPDPAELGPYANRSEFACARQDTKSIMLHPTACLRREQHETPSTLRGPHSRAMTDPHCARRAGRRSWSNSGKSAVPRARQYHCDGNVADMPRAGNPVRSASRVVARSPASSAIARFANFVRNYSNAFRLQSTEEANHKVCRAHAQVELKSAVGKVGEAILI